ncbi:MAG: protein-L-isoaspartate(D-aspartate) O-methyltransferase [Candidatus Lokiarchaeota archaeon]|nr:protein-L-isoaspartate(D-aspartate) O-methyltransferase [Candidatus Lokiarchaeota archaeon]
MSTFNLDEAKQNLLKRYLNSGTAASRDVIEAYLRVKREDFLPENQILHAYEDRPLQIGYNQTISAPHISFIYAEKLDMKVGQKVLEIGAGSGYNAAFFAELVAPSNMEKEKWGHVFTVERLGELVEISRRNLEKAGYIDRITVIGGDGTLGYEKEAPYDRIIVTAAGPEVPIPLKEQLADGGKLIIPVGKKHMYQELMLIERYKNKFKEKRLGGVAFVPLIGKHGFK